jgi:hypothetical protein
MTEFDPRASARSRSPFAIANGTAAPYNVRARFKLARAEDLG